MLALSKSLQQSSESPIYLRYSSATTTHCSSLSISAPIHESLGAACFQHDLTWRTHSGPISSQFSQPRRIYVATTNRNDCNRVSYLTFVPQKTILSCNSHAPRFPVSHSRHHASPPQPSLPTTFNSASSNICNCMYPHLSFIFPFLRIYPKPSCN